MKTETALVPTAPADIAAGAPDQEVRKPRLLGFTVVHGYLKGEHACPYEVHATGCRDLRKLQRTQLSVDYAAEDAEHTIAQAIDDMQGSTKRADYWVQPCTLLKRMKAAGRA